MRIRILGPLEVTDAAGLPVGLGGSRLRTLLIRLTVDAGRTVASDTLAGDLWAGGRPGGSANALQALVSRLRQAAGRDIVESRPGGYRLALSRDVIDSFVFERRVAEARAAFTAGDPARCEALLEQALGLWRGPALADAGDAPFAVAPAARLEELRLAAAEDRLEAGLALGRGPELVPGAEELIRLHPLRERLRGQLMRALQAAGRQADALAVYEETRRLLAESLGVDPSPGLAAVHLAVLRGESQPAPAARPAAALAPGQAGMEQRRRSNLPAQLTSFVGREEEIERTGKLLGESRLVTLTGPGGSGKTRLAIEASARLLGQLPDGVWFVPLAAVRDPRDVPQAVLTALGISEVTLISDAVEGRRMIVVPPLERLADALAIRRLILVLDNAEHVLDAIAELTGSVLAQAPGVRILATSREPLGITGETLCPVPSLPLPPAQAGAGDALRYAAIRLFADRAAAARPGFTITPENVATVILVCRELDGIPLAIELAAARLRSLTLTQVADRLGDRFRLLAVGSRTALPRHQTLRAVVDWSWDLLDDTERMVLRRMSVFTGGATPAAAEQVCALGGDPAGIIDVIASLVDKSLVTATGEAEVRYRLLETVRVYAGERLAEAGEQDQVQAAHAGYFLSLAERAEPQLRGPAQVGWLKRLAADHGNLAAAISYVTGTRDVASALRFISALTFFWLLSDREAEAAKWAQGIQEIVPETVPAGLAEAQAICLFLTAIAAAAADGKPDTAALREVLRQVVAMAGPQPEHPLLALARPAADMFLGDTAAARRGLAALEAHPDPWVRAAQQAFTGHLAINEGDPATAAGALAAGRARFRELGDRWGEAISLLGLADLAMGRGDPGEAVRLLEESHAFAAQGISRNWGEMLHIPLGKAKVALGDLEGGRADLERGVRSARRLGERDDEAAGYLALSDLARREGDLGRARDLAQRALEIAGPQERHPGLAGVAAATLSMLGCLAGQEGDLAAAARWHERALAVLASPELAFLPVNPTLAGVVEGFAALAAARGEYLRAGELLGLAHTLHGFRDGASLDVARTTAAATAAAGAGAFAAAYARGRGLTREDALALRP